MRRPLGDDAAGRLDVLACRFVPAEAQIEDGRPIPEPSDFAMPEWNWETAGEPLVTTAEVAIEFDTPELWS